MQCYHMEDALGMSNRQSGVPGSIITNSEGIMEKCSGPTMSVKRPRRIHPYVVSTQFCRSFVALLGRPIGFEGRSPLVEVDRMDPFRDSIEPVLRGAHYCGTFSATWRSSRLLSKGTPAATWASATRRRPALKRSPTRWRRLLREELRC